VLRQCLSAGRTQRVTLALGIGFERTRWRVVQKVHRPDLVRSTRYSRQYSRMQVNLASPIASVYYHLLFCLNPIYALAVHLPAFPFLKYMQSETAPRRASSPIRATVAQPFIRFYALHDRTRQRIMALACRCEHSAAARNTCMAAISSACGATTFSPAPPRCSRTLALTRRPNSLKVRFSWLP
jgi:hypothetical protein